MLCRIAPGRPPSECDFIASIWSSKTQLMRIAGPTEATGQGSEVGGQKTHLEVFRAKDENGGMNTRNPLVLSVALLVAACFALIPPAIAGSDDQAIIAATKKYLAAKSYPADMKITVEKVEGDYARVGVEPKKKDMDGATAFLKREHGTWKGLTIGTGWDPADLEKLHIPKSLRP